MANEQRILTDFIGGLVDDNPLTDVATTMNSGALAAIPVIGTSSYFPITIDPDGLEGAPEVVFITAHTSGNTSATIVRGRGGTTNVAHSQNIPWVHGVRASDFPNSYDVPWAGDTLAGGPYDYEFDALASAPPSGWAWFNQGGASYAEKYGIGAVLLPAQTGYNVRGIDRAIPTPASWTLTAKMSVAASIDSIDFIGGLVMRDSVGGGLYTFGPHQAVGYDLYGWTNVTTPQGGAKGARKPFGDSAVWYAQIVKNSGTSYDFWLSFDGVGWVPVFFGLNPTTDGFTLDRVGFGAALTNNLASSMACHWMRVR